MKLGEPTHLSTPTEQLIPIFKINTGNVHLYKAAHH